MRKIQRDFQKFEVETELDKWFWPAFSGCWCGMQMGGSAKQRATRQSIAALPFECWLQHSVCLLCALLPFFFSPPSSFLFSHHLPIFNFIRAESAVCNSPRFPFTFSQIFSDFFLQMILKKCQIKSSVREAHWHSKQVTCQRKFEPVLLVTLLSIFVDFSPLSFEKFWNSSFENSRG